MNKEPSFMPIYSSYPLHYYLQAEWRIGVSPSLPPIPTHTYIQDGAVPLGIAAQKGHTQTVQRLLQARANVNHQNKVTCVLQCCRKYMHMIHLVLNY